MTVHAGQHIPDEDATARSEWREARRAKEEWRDRVLHRHGRPGGDPHIPRGLYGLLSLSLRLSGLQARGEQNANSPVLRELSFTFDRLPHAFDGYSILHLSDLHFNHRPGFLEAVCRLVQGVEVDLCAVTGDFRFGWKGPTDKVCENIQRLMAQVTSRDGFLGVLGNHDDMAFDEPFSQIGLRLLFNESVCIERGDARLWVAGVDDPHFYRCADVALATRPIPEDAFRVLLAHSPEVITQADAHHVNLYLCGHTHGGQVCLPGGRPPMVNARCRRKFTRGIWRYGGVQGYTSAGLGTTEVPVRFNCPPEAAIIRLHRAS